MAYGMTAEEIKEFYLKALEYSVGFSRETEIGLSEFHAAVEAENLNQYALVRFFPKDEKTPKMLALLRSGTGYQVLGTREDGSGIKIYFDFIGQALSFMLYSLRALKKSAEP